MIKDVKWEDQAQNIIHDKVLLVVAIWQHYGLLWLKFEYSNSNNNNNTILHMYCRSTIEYNRITTTKSAPKLSWPDYVSSLLECDFSIHTSYMRCAHQNHYQKVIIIHKTAARKILMCLDPKFFAHKKSMIITLIFLRFISHS